MRVHRPFAFVLKESYMRTLTRAQYYKQQSMCRYMSRMLANSQEYKDTEAAMDKAIVDATIYGVGYLKI